VCDPSPEALERRRIAGAKRLPPDSPIVRKRLEVRTEGTIDDIVRRSLALAAKFEKLSPADLNEALAAQRITLAASRMFNTAIAGLRARATVGDISDKKTPPAKPGTIPPPPNEPMAVLDDLLDS
jgi:hypothetical protein